MIYLITNTLTDDKYVGYTSLSLEKRFKTHCANRHKGQTYLNRAMRKYGIENFKIECLQENGNLKEDEATWINQIKPTYNMTKGGEGGDTSESPNYKKGIKNRRSYVGKGNPRYGQFGKDNPKSKQLILDGKYYESITQARKLACKSFQYVKQNAIYV